MEHGEVPTDEKVTGSVKNSTSFLTGWPDTNNGSGKTWLCSYKDQDGHSSLELNGMDWKDRNSHVNRCWWVTWTVPLPVSFRIPQQTCPMKCVCLCYRFDLRCAVDLLHVKHSSACCCSVHTHTGLATGVHESRVIKPVWLKFIGQLPKTVHKKKESPWAQKLLPCTSEGKLRPVE